MTTNFTVTKLREYVVWVKADVRRPLFNASYLANDKSKSVLQLLGRTLHRSQKGPFNSFSKNVFFKKGYYRPKSVSDSNFMPGL